MPVRHPHNQRGYIIGAVLLIAALSLLFGVAQCTDEKAVTAPVDVKEHVTASIETSQPPSTNEPATSVAPSTIEPTTLAASPEPPATTPPVEAQPLPADDAAAWHCLAVLESGDGTASSNIYGIQSSRVYGMSRAEQLAWARRIRDENGGSYLPGWPNTGRECGLS